MASKIKKTEYVTARTRVALSPGDAVRVTRELQELTQAELARVSTQCRWWACGRQRARNVMGPG
jgi:hypothetical protein